MNSCTCIAPTQVPFSRVRSSDRPGLGDSSSSHPARPESTGVYVGNSCHTRDESAIPRVGSGAGGYVSIVRSGVHLFARNSGAQRAWLSSLGAIVALVGLLAVGTMDSATMTRVDLTVVASLHAHAIEPVTAASLAVTALGSTQYALAALAIAVALFAAWRHWRGLLTVALAVAMAQGAVALVKLLVA